MIGPGFALSWKKRALASQPTSQPERKSAGKVSSSIKARQPRLNGILGLLASSDECVYRETKKGEPE
jgi:hypothetical protein